VKGGKPAGREKKKDFNEKVPKKKKKKIKRPTKQKKNCPFRQACEIIKRSSHFDERKKNKVCSIDSDQRKTKF
jgi:hypothetical protein